MSQASRLTWVTRLMALWSLIVFPTWLVLPFVVARTAAWTAAWVYFVAMGVALLAHRAFVARRNPELLRRRQRLGADTKRWDIVWNFLFWPLMATTALVAGFDVRSGRAPMPAWLWAVGLALLAAGIGLSAWAMSVNPHFEGTVRIQKDLGHRVIDAGPYRVIRHPGYAGLALWALASPFLLRSSSALVPASAVIAWLLLRTALEDATLRRELPGYIEYAARVRFRFAPGIW